MKKLMIAALLVLVAACAKKDAADGAMSDSTMMMDSTNMMMDSTRMMDTTMARDTAARM